MMNNDRKRVPIKTCYGKFDIAFNIDEAKESNILVSGSNHTGKSRLSAGICSILQTFNWKVVAVDNTGIWKEISDIPTFYRLEKERNYDEESKRWHYPFPKTSMLYDTSLLVPSLQKSFVNQLSEQLWNYQVYTKSSIWTLLALEESQLFMRTVRGSVSESILRAMSAGRNQRIRVLAVNVDLALLDPSFIRLCSQRFYARLNIEENSKRKFRNYHGLDWTRVATELDLGFFIYMLREKLKIVHVPCFETKRIPQPYHIPMPTPQLRKPKGLWEKFIEWIK